MNITKWTIIAFQQRDGQDSRLLNNDTFRGLPVNSAQGIIGTEKDTHAGELLNYDDDDFSREYGQIKEASRALTKDDILQPYKFNNNFRSSNIRADDVAHNLCVFDMRYQQSFSAFQPIKVEFKLDGVVPNDINVYALVLTNELVSVSSDGQRNFELI